MDSTPTSPRLQLLRGSDDRKDDVWVDVDLKDDATPVKEVAEDILQHDKKDWVT